MATTNNSANYVPVIYNILSGGANNSINSISPGPAGTVLVSSGASAQPTYQFTLMTASTTLTNAQVKAFSNNTSATSVTLIPAVAGHTIIVQNSYAILNYGGTSAFTAAASQIIRLYYGSPTGATAGGSTISNNLLVSTSTSSGFTNPTALPSVLASTKLGQSIIINQTTNTLITGNAANDNTISVWVSYMLMPI